MVYYAIADVICNQSAIILCFIRSDIIAIYMVYYAIADMICNQSAIILCFIRSDIMLLYHFLNLKTLFFRTGMKNLVT